jgi:hypothetical protein
MLEFQPIRHFPHSSSDLWNLSTLSGLKSIIHTEIWSETTFLIAVQIQVILRKRYVRPMQYWNDEPGVDLMDCLGKRYLYRNAWGNWQHLLHTLYTEKKVPQGINEGFVLGTKLKKSFVNGTEPEKVSISLQKWFGIASFFQCSTYIATITNIVWRSYPIYSINVSKIFITSVV